MHGFPVSTWPRWVVPVLLFLAAAALWGTGLAYVASSWMTPSSLVTKSEHILVTYAGEPVIMTQDYLHAGPNPTRTLDGKLLPKNTLSVNPHYLNSAPPFRTFLDVPPTWDTGRLGTEDGQIYTEYSGLYRSEREEDNDTEWYLVTDGTTKGLGFFVGFDKRSKLQVGSIGRQGLISGTPSRDEQFVVGGITSRTVSVPSLNGTTPWDRHFYFFDDDQVVDVNLTKQTVRIVTTISGAKSMTLVSVVDRETAERIVARGAEDEADSGEEDKIERKMRLAAWNGNNVTVIDPVSGDRVDFALPEGAPELGSIDIYSVTDDQLVVSYPIDPNDRSQWKLTWLAPTGTGGAAANRVETVQLTRGVSSSTPDREAILVNGSAPIPALLGLLTVTLGALGEIRNGHADTYIDGLKEALRILGPGLVVVTICSAALAWYVYRSERSQRRARARWLAALIFALGLPAFLAYLATRRRPPMGRCAACGADVPQDRALCAACGVERARPRVSGVEVFA